MAQWFCNVQSSMRTHAVSHNPNKRLIVCVCVCVSHVKGKRAVVNVSTEEIRVIRSDG